MVYLILIFFNNLSFVYIDINVILGGYFFELMKFKFMYMLL